MVTPKNLERIKRRRHMRQLAVFGRPPVDCDCPKLALMLILMFTLLVGCFSGRAPCLPDPE